MVDFIEFDDSYIEGAGTCRRIVPVWSICSVRDDEHMPDHINVSLSNGVILRASGTLEQFKEIVNG